MSCLAFTVATSAVMQVFDHTGSSGAQDEREYLHPEGATT